MTSASFVGRVVGFFVGMDVSSAPRRGRSERVAAAASASCRLDGSPGWARPWRAATAAVVVAITATMAVGQSDCPPSDVFPQVPAGSTVGTDMTARIVPPGPDKDAYRWETTPAPYPSPLDIDGDGVSDMTWAEAVSSWSCCWDAMVHLYARGGNSDLIPWVSLYHTWSDSSGTHGFVLPRGFRLNVNLLASPSLGDYLPAGPTVGASSVPLVPLGAAGMSTGWQGSHRPVLDGRIDLVTGMPLLRAVDLELPFGSAMFRLTRTRSQFHGLQRIDDPSEASWASDPDIAAADRYWDWTGLGWMIGENPLLLIDSALPDIVGPNPRTTWLVLDAHHAIPFQQVNLAPDVDGNPRVGYEAPPRFRARMTHNGIWGRVTSPGGESCVEVDGVWTGDCAYGWLEPPTEYEVWLYDGLLKYTFVAVRGAEAGGVASAPYQPPFGDDVPLRIWDANYLEPDAGPNYIVTSYHDLAHYSDEIDGATHSYYNSGNDGDPENPGLGIPYYGLCRRIEDRHGNVVEISYCPVTRQALDDPSTTGCVECQQVCLRKGMINHVRLRSGDTGEIDWTLLYAYRAFTGDTVESWSDPSGSWPASAGSDWTASVHGLASIDRIYVYKGDLFADQPGLADSICLLIPSSDRPYGSGPMDPLEPYPGLRSDWSYQVRYHYRTKEWNPALEDHGVPLEWPILIRTTVTTRAHEADGTVVEDEDRATERHTFYRHRVDEGVLGEVSHLPTLDRIYTHEDYVRLLGWADELMNEPPDDATAAQLAVAAWVDGLSDAHEFAVAAFASALGKHEPWGDEEFEVLAGFASTHMNDPPYVVWPEGPTEEAPDPVKIRSTYVTSIGDGQRLFNDSSYHRVGIASLRDDAGTVRHYRIHRLIVGLYPVPPPSGAPNPPFHFDGADIHSGVDTWAPRRSLFTHPYRWNPVRAWRSGSVAMPEELRDAAPLDEPRWITIIDEFGSREALMDEDAPYAGEYSTKPGQLSRRVVEVNAAGYVLRDKKWEFRGGDVLVTGGGLGEQYIYQTIEDYFEAMDISVADDLLPTVEDSNPKDTVDDRDAQIQGFLRELLLVEHRSVGWSAADIAGDGEAEGLVSHRVYEWFGTDGDTPADTPWRTRVQLKAEAISSGTGGSKLYRRQWFRDPASPADVVADVEFLSESGAPALLGSVPDPTVDQEHYKVTRWVTERAEPDDPDLPATEWPVVKRVTIGPPRVLRPTPVGSTPTWYYPVEAEFYDEDDGTLMWSASGLVTNPERPSDGGDALDRLIFTYHEYEDGRLRATVVDAEPGTRHPPDWPQQSVEVPPFPGEGWVRLGSMAALNYVTYYEYDRYGPRDIWLPNGRRWARRTVMLTALPANPDDQDLLEHIDEPNPPDDPLGLYLDWLMPGPSDFIGGALEALVEDYGANLEWDVEWATDWSMEDDWHTRLDNTWIAYSLMRGLYDSFYIGVPGTEIGFNPLDHAFAGKRKRSVPIASPGPYKPGRGPYSHLPDPPGVRAGKPFARAQIMTILRANRARHGGILRCDVTGRALIEGGRSPNSAVVDHIRPKANGGTNSYGNAQVVSHVWNSSKRNRFSGRRKRRPQRQRRRSIPPPAVLQLRWRQVALLGDLVFAQTDRQAGVMYEIDRRGVGRGVWNDYQGSCAWFACSDAGALLYGAWADAPIRWEEHPRIETRARRRIARLPSSVRRLVHPRPRQSMGWTFAMWSRGSFESWQDLTGHDARCEQPLRLPGSEALFGTSDAVQHWIREQLGRSDLETEADRLLRFMPLTKAAAARMWVRDKALLKVRGVQKEPRHDFIRGAALRVGYPLASEWWDDTE